MSNIKVAFDRYVEFQSTQRRALMLRWCLGFGSNEIARVDLLGRKSMLIPVAADFSLRKLVNIKRNLWLWKKDFSTTTSRYFDNNFDIIVNRDLNPNEIILMADEKLLKLRGMLERHPDGREGKDDTETLEKEIRDTFKWLFGNKLYGICFDLLKLITKSHYSSFQFIDFRNLVVVIDKYGSVDDLFDMFEAFAANPTVSQLPLLSHLNANPLVSGLVNLYRSHNQEEIILILDSIISSYPERIQGNFGFNSILTKICSCQLSGSHDDRFANQLIEKLMQSSIPKSQYDYDLVRQIYRKTLASKNLDAAVLLMRTIVNDESVSYQRKQSLVFAAIKHSEKEPLNACYLWALLFPAVEFNYETTPDELLILKHRWIFGKELPLNLADDKIIASDEVVLSRIISLLIYGHSRWGSRDFVRKLYAYKESLGLSVEISDEIGLLRSLVHLKKYDEALDLISKCSKEDERFVSPESYDSIFLCLAKSEKWDELKDKFDFLFEKEQITTMKQYSVMFMVLASRGATKYVLDLWDTFLKRGFKPDDMILCSIIFSFIKTKSYAKALQWFSAYSYYKVPLSSKSYGMMLNGLASTHDFQSCFKMLDELAQKNITLNSYQMEPFLRQCALLGDHKSIELILSKYYPTFGIPVTPRDSRWILRAHYYGNRFGVVVETYERQLVREDKVAYQDTLLALEAASKYTNVSKFYQLWDRCLKMHADQMTVEAYIIYMGVNVRIHGLYGCEQILDEVQQRFKLKYLPVRIFNEMIFSSIRMGRPWYAPTIVKMSLMRGVVPSSKTYSLLLQSNTSLYQYSEEHIDETIQLLNEILLNRKKDKLGKFDKDLNPMSFKLVIMHIIRFKGVEEARKYFELYVENSKNYLLDNIHILQTELLLLGEEGRWEEFGGCYDRYLSLVKAKLQYARMKNDEELYDNIESDRISSFYDHVSPVSVNESSIKFSRMPSVGIPSSLKKALFTVWPYRLKQLADTEQLDEVMSIVGRLFKEGFILSNKNLNETALLLSGSEDLIPETVAFINKYILPGHILHRRLALTKMKYRMSEIPHIHEPEIRFINDIYFGIMRNIDGILSARLNVAQKETLLDSIMISDTKTVMKNLRSIIRSQSFIDRVYTMTRKKAGKFYRRKHHIRRMRRVQKERLMKFDKIDEMMNYRKRWLALKERKQSLLVKIDNTTDSSERLTFLHEMADVKKGFEQLRADRKVALETLRQQQRDRKKIDDERVYKIGRINIFKLQPKVSDSPLIEEPGEFRPSNNETKHV
ncbi:DEKNAAC102979 [Brettanomyces naardenensis]|uniref:DEKNAAC102979 n=1 Tax=Brettanomyces naardenensis TaxID=13370 RepID=A0A448YLZ7_BRENA|nr:DEKNAAC102979 [Brettanomyces naardenensis]